MKITSIEQLTEIVVNYAPVRIQSAQKADKYGDYQPLWTMAFEPEYRLDNAYFPEMSQSFVSLDYMLPAAMAVCGEWIVDL